MRQPNEIERGAICLLLGVSVYFLSICLICLPTSPDGYWQRVFFGLIIVAVILGGLFCEAFLRIVRGLVGVVQPKDWTWRHAAGRFVLATVERFMFTIFIGAQIEFSIILPAFFGWIGLKVAANWRRREAALLVNRGELTAIHTTLFGFVFILIGGLIVQGDVDTLNKLPFACLENSRSK